MDPRGRERRRVSEWQFQLVLEYIKIAIFCAQLILLLIVAGRLRNVDERLRDLERVLSKLGQRFGADE
jgi:hypothetical protein